MNCDLGLEFWLSLLANKGLGRGLIKKVMATLGSIAPAKFSATESTLWARLKNVQFVMTATG